MNSEVVGLMTFFQLLKGSDRFFVRFCWEKKGFSGNFQKLRGSSPPLPPPMLENMCTLVRHDQYLENKRNFLCFAEVDQMRRRDKVSSTRPIFPTSIVTNANLNSGRARPKNKQQQGRPIPSVFLTEDPVR